MIEAASRLFTTNGWAATGMRDVAREAGVATETVYAHFSSKVRLFQRAADLAVGGDDADVALADRPAFRALATGSRAERIAAAASLVTEINERTAGFAKALREAAPADATIADMLRATRERIRLDIGAGLEHVMGRRPTAEERDGLWALLSVEVFLLLVEESGWSTGQYRDWMTGALERLIPRS